MEDKEYWNNYYKHNSAPNAASSFAEFILPNLEKGKTLIDLGCGNGRDSVYFSQNDLEVTAVDQVCDEIKYLNENYGSESLSFVCGDFTNLIEEDNELIKDNKFDYAYSRFTFHSINEKKEDRALNWIYNALENGGCFLLEARSINDPMFKEGEKLSESENFTTHYRRYLDLATFVEKLEKMGFEVLYKIEDNDLAVYKDDNPYVIRIIAKK